MSSELALTHAALEDLRSFSAYTLNTWGEEQEVRYRDRIWARFESIRLDPTRSRLRPDLFPDCRSAAEGKHVILFKTRENVLEIIRVLHSAMDFKRRFQEEASFEGRNIGGLGGDPSGQATDTG